MATRLRTVRADGTPVYRYDQRAGALPIGVVRFDHGQSDPLPRDHRHAHDFVVLAYIERGAGSARIDGSDAVLRDGDVYLVAPGQVLEIGSVDALDGGRAWAAYFMPEALTSNGSADFNSPLLWSRHPLLRLFAPGVADHRRPLVVPEDQRQRWAARFAELADETGHPERLGSREAAVAALTSLLVAAARLDRSAAAPARSIDPLIARVFDVVEARYQEPISTRDVADQLGYTTGHLTTLVRERTGRTVLDWITERRMIEARRLLAETDLAVSTIATRTGHRDADYLVRRFRSRYGVTPQRWRQLIREP